MLLSHLAFLLPKNQFLSSVLDCNHTYPLRPHAVKPVLADDRDELSGRGCHVPMKVVGTQARGCSFRAWESFWDPRCMSWWSAYFLGNVVIPYQRGFHRRETEMRGNSRFRPGQWRFRPSRLFEVCIQYWQSNVSVPRDADTSSLHIVQKCSYYLQRLLPHLPVTAHNKGLQAPWWTWCGFLSELIRFFLLLMVKAA